MKHPRLLIAAGGIVAGLGLLPAGIGVAAIYLFLPVAVSVTSAAFVALGATLIYLGAKGGGS